MRLEPNIREITTVLEAVEARTGVPMSQLLGQRRHVATVYARIEAAKRLRARGYSTPQIGKVLNRNHTTIVFYLGNGKKKPVPLRWRAPKITHLARCPPFVKQPEFIQVRTPDPAYLLPYAGADREYQWKVRPT